jgi:hypothetical protein
VLIPYGRCAFWEGELQPLKISKKGLATKEASGDVSDHDRNPKTSDQEQVFVAGPRPETAAAATTAAADFIPMSLTDVIKWLEGYSSKHETSTQDGSLPHQTESKSVTTPSETSTPVQPSVPARPDAVDAIFPMMEIQEEYTEDGKQVYGKAVDVSSRLQHLWNKVDHDNSDGETKTPHPDDLDDHDQVGVGGTLSNEAVAVEEASSPPPVVSDEEYDRLAKRLEELEMLEDRELQMEHRTKARHPTSTKPKKQTGLSFQKGFLNAKPKTKPKAKTPAVGATAASSAQASAPAATDEAVTKKSKITIDLNKNTVQEIPQEGRQQPLPPRQQQSTQSPSQQRQTMADSNMFTGHIQERTAVATTSGGTVSAEQAAASSCNANQRSTPTKKKRVSRFAQERMQQ